MKTAAGAMKKQMKQFNIDDVENLQDELTDMLDMNNEIQETLGRSYGVGDIDESELEGGKSLFYGKRVRTKNFLELDALGEELVMESSASYLQAATVPDTEPSLSAPSQKNPALPLTN